MWAHPRRRGEHGRCRRTFYAGTGSSPQARGTRFAGWSRRRSRGLIPAGAGNTTERCQAHASPTAHPRRRGEHCGKHSRQRQAWGSSPQARGTRPTIRPYQPLIGLIPAGAGNTGLERYWPKHGGAHPRRRGEHSESLQGVRVMVGSSPQARVTLVLGLERGCGGGLIPAGAGNTGRMRGPGRGGGAHPRRRGEHTC